jgi:hypothetical protein
VLSARNVVASAINGLWHAVDNAVKGAGGSGADGAEKVREVVDQLQKGRDPGVYVTGSDEAVEEIASELQAGGVPVEWSGL